MKFIKVLFLVLITTAFALTISCKQKEMTIEDFAKIDIEITSTNMKPGSIDKVAKKYGYNVKIYNKFQEKVENDPKLKEKLGEVRLKALKTDKKKK